MSNQIVVSTFTKLNAGKKVTIDLDLGWKYLAVHIKRTNFTAAQALNYKLKINGKVRQELESLQVMEDMNTHYNRPQVAGFTTLFFSRPELADSEDRDATGLGTRDIRTLQIEFVLDAAVVSPDMAVVADVTSNELLGWINHIESADIDILKVGKNVISKMPVGNGNVFSYFLGKATQDITDIVLKRTVDGDKNNVLESTKEFLEVEQKQAAMRPRVPVTATYTVVDFTTKGIPEDALQTDTLDIPGKGLLKIDRVAMDITVGTIEPLTVITESVGPFNG